MEVAVAGASGFIGRRLVPALAASGHHVRALSRHPAKDPLTAPGEPGSVRNMRGDVRDASTLAEPLRGAEALIYLVHSLGDKDFEREDADAAWTVAQAAADAGVSRIVYLGGLGDDSDNLSTHLRSRREVEGLLGQTGIPVTVLRAGIIVGAGGISWEMTRQLVAHLPAMVAPKWVATRCQPIAVDDVVAYIVEALDKAETIGETYDVGGPDVLTYKQMMQHAARMMGKRPRPVMSIPLLTPRLSSFWLQFVTDVDSATASDLVDSMTNEVVVRDDRITKVIPRELLSYDEAVRRALHDRANGDR